MIILTGGAGMIGSVIAWHLNSILDRKDIIVVDDIQHQDQWNNLSKRTYIDYLDKDDLFPWLEKKQEIEAIIHMGAISATTETDFNKLLNQNIRYSQNLWRYASDHNVPFLYASSAATYGGGEFGYDDNESELRKLRPLNAYGYSKQFFDQWAVQQVLAKEKTPPQWCGFKFLMSMVQTNTIKIEWQALHFMHLINLKQRVKLDSSRAIVPTIKMVCNQEILFM